MTKSDLIDRVIEQTERIWGIEGFGGDWSEYAWLFETYGITEEDDVHWQLILEHNMDDLSDEDLEDEELMLFLNEDSAVNQFLQDLLWKYQSSIANYPG